METLYRKVTFEIEQQDNYKTVLIGKNANFIFNPNTRNGEELTDFLSGCEEITDTSHQIEKLEPLQGAVITAMKEYASQQTTQLQKDKEELIEMLELASLELESGGKAHWEINLMMKNLIQKHNP